MKKSKDLITTESKLVILLTFGVVILFTGISINAASHRGWTPRMLMLEFIIPLFSFFAGIALLIAAVVIIVNMVNRKLKKRRTT